MPNIPGDFDAGILSVCLRYSISGKESRHNLKYVDFLDYLCITDQQSFIHMNNQKKKNNKNKTALNLVLGLLCAAVSIYCIAAGVKHLTETGNAKDMSNMSVAEIVQRLQKDLPLKGSGEFCTITQTGLEVRGDTLAFVSTIEFKDDFHKKFNIQHFQKSFYENGLSTIVQEYGTHLLTRRACEEEMVFTYEYSDPDGNLVSRIDFAPEVYKPLL